MRGSRLRIQRGRLYRLAEIILMDATWQSCDQYTRHWTWRHA